MSKQKTQATKRIVTIRLDNDMLEWFKSDGAGYQTRINQVLRDYMQRRSVTRDKRQARGGA